MVTFSAHRVPLLCEHLSQAIGRGVEVTLLLESEQSSAGQLSFDASKAFKELGLDHVRLLHWPQVALLTAWRGDMFIHFGLNKHRFSGLVGAGEKVLDVVSEDADTPSLRNRHDDHGVFVITGLGAGLIHQILQHGFGGHALEVERNLHIGELLFRILENEVGCHRVLRLFFDEHTQGIEGFLERRRVKIESRDDDRSEGRLAAFRGDGAGIEFQLAEAEAGVGVLGIRFKRIGIGFLRGGGITRLLSGETLAIESLGLTGG